MENGNGFPSHGIVLLRFKLMAQMQIRVITYNKKKIEKVFHRLE